MITPVDNILCGPLNSNKINIENTLLKNIDYSSEVLPDGFISRNVNIAVNENENNKPTFTKIINDCRKKSKTYEGDKYKELILNKQEPGEDEKEETLEKMIANMERKIKSIDDKIYDTYKKTVLLDNSLPESYTRNITFQDKDKEILTSLNMFLEQFAKNKITKNDL